MVAVILVNYNGFYDTIKCVDSILESDYTFFKVIIVDNDSNDNSVEEISKSFDLVKNDGEENALTGLTSVYTNSNKQIILLTSYRNSGFAGANNLGIKYTERYYPEFEFYWLLNNDTIIECNSLRQIVNRAKESASDIGIIGTNLLYLDNPNIIQALGGKYNPLSATCRHIGAHMNKCECYEIIKAVRADYVVGASMLVKKTFVNSVGYMEESYFLYFEELDWILRGKQYGWGFFIDYDINIYHKEGGSTKATHRLISEVADKCQLRNRILFTKKFYPSCLFLVLCSTFLTIVKRFMSGHINRSKVLLNVFCEEVKKICIRAK